MNNLSALRKKYFLNPTQMIVFSFLSIIGVGTLLLLFPWAATETSLHFVDALFIAVSATCVTGLTVLNVGTELTSYGQWIVLIMIQLGGLGIMTFSTFFLYLFGRKVSIRSREVIGTTLSYMPVQNIRSLIKKIVVIVLFIEISGAVLLIYHWQGYYPLPKAIYHGIFHSISAFCNAGFDIFGSENEQFISLMNFNKNPIMLITTSLLIIIGGLGFIVWNDVVSKRKFSRFTLHTKVVLTGTLILILFGLIMFLVFENNNSGTIGSMKIPEKILNAFFHSVTSRTAGFNAISTADTKEATNFFTIILMFIGAAPGSTAGGIKVTTFFIILLTVISFTKGKEEVQVFERRISNSIKSKAISIMFLSALLILFVVFAMLFSSEGDFIQVLYEATSAFGTVGLSTGITPDLNLFDKCLLMVTMFLGRIGPFTAIVAFAAVKDKKSFSYRYPEGKITVG